MANSLINGFATCLSAPTPLPGPVNLFSDVQSPLLGNVISDSRTGQSGACRRS